MVTVPYRGPVVGCTWCAYTVKGSGPIPDVPRARVTLQTERGPRQVCDNCAARGTWLGRRHRVGAVA